MRRAHFNEDADQAAAPAKPSGYLRLKCHAHGCPMPGAIEIAGQSACGWHARENPAHWGKITDALVAWECLTVAINRARRVLSAPDTCADPKQQDNALREIWADLVPAFSMQGSGWKRRVEPSKGEHLGEWVRRMHLFLAARVKERIGGGAFDESKPTQAVAEMLKDLRAVPLGARNNVEDHFQ